jgi:RNA polymerase sigma factor (sigma-70 family)
MLQCLRHACAADEVRDLNDAELLRRFLALREEAAFAVLVQRHGPMVLGVCRRVLGDAHGAEDAFQATFIVLVRRAASLACTGSLANWLYTVAQRIASKARAQAAARRLRERRSAEMPRSQPLDEPTWQELRSVLDDEIGRLPEKYRAPIVLCYFEGKSQARAAQELGWATGSLASRLARARQVLRRQLARRGIALSAGTLIAVLGEKASAVPLTAVLTLTTVQAAASIAAGKTAAGCLSARAVALAEEAMKPLPAINKRLLLVLMALGLTLGGAGLGAYGGLTETPPAIAEDAQTATTQTDSNNPATKVALVAKDLYGDPLPDGAVARLGTVRFRHGKFTTKVAFAQGGKLLISAGGDLSGFGLCLWDAASGRLLQRLPALENDPTNSFAVSADGTRLVTGDRWVIEVATGKMLRRLKGPDTEGVAISPDGQMVAAGESDAPGRVVLWDVASGKELRRLAGLSERVSAVAFAPGGKTVAAGGADKTVILWNVETGQELRRFEGHQKRVQSLAFSSTGKFLAASAERDMRILLWDVETGKLLHQLQGDGKLTSAGPDHGLLASAGSDGLIRVWDPVTGKELRRWVACRWGPRGFTTAAFSPDGKVLASAGMFDHAIRLWDAGTGKDVSPLPLAGHTGVVASLRFAADGKTLVSSGDDNQVIEWDLAGGRERGRLFGDRLGSLPEGWSWSAHDLSADGAMLALFGNTAGKQDPVARTMDPGLRLLDVATGKERCAVKISEWMRSVRISPDGKLLAADGRDSIGVWSVATGQELLRLPGQKPHRSTLVFSPDSKLLAWAGDADRTIHLCDVATGKELRRWPSQQEKVWVVIFSPDGKSIATAARAGVQLWSVDKGELLRQLPAPRDVESLAFSGSGRILAVGQGEPAPSIVGEGKAPRLSLWETFSGEEIRQIAAPQGSVSALAFAPDGRTLASGGGNSTILLWDLTHQAKSAAVPAAADLERLWADLGGSAAQADVALWTLATTPKQSAPFLKHQLQPVTPADAKEVAQLMADLDNQNFAVRQKAGQALDAMGEAAEAAIRKTLEGSPPLEVRQRLEQILEKRNREVFRRLRAVEALEQMATPEARQILEGIAKTAVNPRIAQAASVALKRLAKQL